MEKAKAFMTCDIPKQLYFVPWDTPVPLRNTELYNLVWWRLRRKGWSELSPMIITAEIKWPSGGDRVSPKSRIKTLWYLAASDEIMPAHPVLVNVVEMFHYAWWKTEENMPNLIASLFDPERSVDSLIIEAGQNRITHHEIIFALRADKVYKGHFSHKQNCKAAKRIQRAMIAFSWVVWIWSAALLFPFVCFCFQFQKLRQMSFSCGFVRLFCGCVPLQLWKAILTRERTLNKAFIQTNL